MIILTAASAPPAAAQELESIEWARRALDLSPDPLLRSPRLIGMGRLTLADDHRNRLTMWDFAGNPTGILEADSGSTVEFWPVTSASSGRRNSTTRPGTEREYFALRDARVGYEMWKRAEGTTYGFYGDIGTLRFDTPYTDDVERRNQFQEPRIIVVLNGRMPYTQNNRMKYALRAGYAREDNGEEYRRFFTNDAGDYIGKDGQLVDPPDFFTPDKMSVSSIVVGAAMGYRFGSLLDAAIGFDGISSRITGENAGPRYFSGTGEDRPTYVGQASIVSGSGPFQLALDGRAWDASSDESFVFTLAGGIGQEPLSGRGPKLHRDEEGSSLRTRARWDLGTLEVGAAYNTGYRQVVTTPAESADLFSFNHFRNTILDRQGADSLALPDSIGPNRIEQRSYEAVAGASMDALGGVAGVEFHAARQRVDQVNGGEGPVRKVWDVRAGLERPFTPILKGRLGYIYRQDDRDELSEGNEYLGHTVSGGLGLIPASATWVFNLAYAVEWLTPDFADPTESRESRQTLAFEVRWAF